MKLQMDPRHLEVVRNIIQRYDYSFFAFGSRVTGKHKKLSDLDLFYTETIPSNVLLQLEEDFEESDLPFTVDLVDFCNCEKGFQNRILENYVCLQRASTLKTPALNHLDHFLFLSRNV